MNLKPFTGPGSIPPRRSFWKDARSAVLSAQKIAGRNVTVDEHLGKGSVINVVRPERLPAPSFVCPDDLLSTVQVTFAGITLCGCVDYSIIHEYPEYVLATDNNVNGTITFSISGFPPWSGVNEDLTWHTVFYNASDCTDQFDEHTNIGFAAIWCTDDGTGFNVYYVGGIEGVEVLFYAVVTSLGVATPNLISCGEYIDPVGASPFNAGVAVGSGGTVTVTATP